MMINCDVLIVGSGVAGLYAALNLRRDLNVILVSKTTLKETNTYLAQGGISTAKDEEDIEAFIEDTLRAGNYKNNLEAVRVFAKESMENIKRLIDFGVEFDNIDGRLLFTKEGAHSTNRIVHVKDWTGKAVAKTLIKNILKRKNIKVYENTKLIDILSKDNRCLGGIFIRNGKRIDIHSKVTILATGGIGGLFKNSTNQRVLTGDGLAIAVRHGVKIKDIEFIQFHPTAFYEEKDERRFLISESLRGEGAILLNYKGERFVDELLPRDEVSLKILEEIRRSNKPYVFLSARHLNSSYLRDRFPNIYNECLKRGVDITKDLVPVAPAQHYFMGGIEVDLFSKTSMENLYAVGEVSCTGVHGENRLASNSLLEGLVFSRRAAEDINKNIDSISPAKTYKNDLNNIEELERENKRLVIKELKKKRWDLKDEFIDY
ncbi:MAG: L-aspartate oxidase [Caloramator sp.]|nr:L-aspartate oxidase [Caloramator sp.]